MQSFVYNSAEEKLSSASFSLPVDQITDEALILALAGQEDWAIEPLYHRYSRLLYSVAYHMVNNRQVAEDILQDTFIAIWKHASTYSQQSGAVHRWLISILHHRTIDYLRGVRRQAMLKQVTWEVIEQDEGTFIPDAWEEAWQSIQSRQIHDAVTKLSSEQRMVIELAYFQGWTHNKIAEEYQLPLGTVKSRMRLGMMHLKEMLEKTGMHE